MKRLLMIAYHYPPAVGSSGVQRALRFSRHLPQFGWQPIVLTAHPRAYPRRSDDLLDQIPDEAPIIRAQAWNTQRHLSIAGRYPAFLALPDRWWPWYFGAVPAGLAAIKRFRPDAIWSTYPIATAHWIGASLASFTKLPLIADFRDPMVQDGHQCHPLFRWSSARVEKQTVRTATISTFTTPSAVEMYRNRYPDYGSRMCLLENGYDESVFAEQPSTPLRPLNDGKITLLHSGIVYPSERDPSALFAALRELRLKDRERFSRLVIRFRAAAHDDHLQMLAREFGIQESVQTLPRIPYADAIQEMQRADALLVLQSSNYNAQIPAKFYEYLRAGKPIVVVADPAGDTASAARAAGIETIADFDDSTAIMSILEQLSCGRPERLAPGKSAMRAATRQASRHARTQQLAALLDSALSETSEDTCRVPVEP